MIKLFATLMVISAGLSSCSKHESNTVSDKVRIRIENATGFTLENANIGNTIYGDIVTGQLTGYKIMNEPIYTAYCSFRVNNIQSGAGVGICGTGLPPPFGSGSYTFKVMPAANGYNSISVTKR